MGGIIQEEVVEGHQFFCLKVRGGGMYLGLFWLMRGVVLLLHFKSQRIDGE